VDQQTGFVTIDPNSYSPNIVQDLTPQLGGDLDVLNQKIFSSTGDVKLTDNVKVDGTTAPLKENYSSTFYPVVTGRDIGTANDQAPLNNMLGQLAFLDDVARIRASAAAPVANLDINFEYVSDTSIKIRMRGSDGTVRSTTLTLS
jgi:hypothetical protein